jgi:hypothetical protein
MTRIIPMAVLLGILAVLFPMGFCADDPVQTSLIQLIATPDKFDGKTVSVTGFLHVGRESALLFLGQNDHDHDIAANAISFRLDEKIGKDTKELKENYVTLVGIFHAPQRPGAYPCPNGKIDPVERYRIWSTLSNPEGRRLDQ